MVLWVTTTRARSATVWVISRVVGVVVVAAPPKDGRESANATIRPAQAAAASATEAVTRRQWPSNRVDGGRRCWKSRRAWSPTIAHRSE